MTAKIRTFTIGIFAVLAAIAALQPAQASANDEGSLYYTIKSGDTLYSFGERYLLTRAAAGKVAQLNRIRNPRRIPVGTVIEIPRPLLKFENVTLRVRSFSGPAEIAGKQPKVGNSLNEGNWVETGRNGFIAFQGNRGMIISLPSNTRAQLVRARQYTLGDILDVDFNIAKGRAEITAPKLKKQERFRMRTPAAVTAVRGTIFRVAHDEASANSIAEVLEGAVAVEAGDAAGVAQSGFGVVLSNQGVGEPEQLLPAPSLADPGEVQTSVSVAFAIVPLDRAASYRTQIAKDAGFMEIIAGKLAPGTDVAFDNIPNGRYFVRSRGVSAVGIEGQSETYSFKRKRLGVSASVEPSPLADGFKFSWLSQGDGESSFAFQLWNEKDAGAPLVDEIGVQDTGYIVTNLAAGDYVWRVAVVQAGPDGLLKVWSPEQKFKVSK